MSRPVQALLKDALEAINRGDTVSARPLLEEVLRREPRNVDALNFKSIFAKREGDVGAARQLMQQALAADSRRADIHGNLGNLHATLGQYEEAVAAYRAALHVQPGFRAAQLGLARSLLALGDAAAAIAAATTLIERESGDAEAWNVLGTARRLAGDYDGAEQAFRAAVRAAPAYAVARHNLGAMLVQLSRSEAALEELDAATSAGLGGPELAHNRASALMALGRFAESRATLEAALADSPGAVNLHGLLARLRYMQGDVDFVSHLEAAIENRSGDVRLAVACSQLLRGAEKLDAALDAMQRGLAGGKVTAPLLAEMSAVHHDRGEYQEALEFARRAAAANPADARLRDLEIQALLSLGDGAAAMPLIESARERQPLDQFYIALEASAARLLGERRYEWLYDYERLVLPFELPVPAGWSSIAAFHADLIPVLVERHQFVAPPLDQSIRAGTQTPRGLLGDPDPTVRAFLDAIRAPVREYCERIGTDPAHPLSSRNTGETRVVGCWSVRLHRNGFHVNHVHSEGWISSAYYVEVPDEVDDDAAQSGWLRLGEPKFGIPGATPEKLVKPAAGKLVLFPSYMWHGTTPIKGDSVRMSIAFDVVPRPDT